MNFLDVIDQAGVCVAYVVPLIHSLGLGLGYKLVLRASLLAHNHDTSQSFLPGLTVS